MSIDFEMSLDIVMAPSTDLGDHWSKVARERIRSKGNDIRSRGFFTGIPMNLISNEAKSHIRDKICAQLSILDLRRWSGNGHYPHRSGLKIYRGDNKPNP